MQRLSGQPQCPPAPRWVRLLAAMLLTLLVFAGIILFLLWLILSPKQPTFYVVDFSISNANHRQQLALAGSGLADLPVQFTVRANNPNDKIGIYYDEIVASVFCFHQLIATGPVTTAFYQQPKVDTAVQVILTAWGPVPTDPSWTEFVDAMNSTGHVKLYLVLTSKARFEANPWDRKPHKVKVRCYTAILADGKPYRPQRFPQDLALLLECPEMY